MAEMSSDTLNVQFIRSSAIFINLKVAGEVQLLSYRTCVVAAVA